MAITDWVGSNASDIYFLDATNPANATRLEIWNVQQLVPSGELAGHCYYEALSWVGENQLNIRIFGHTDENPSHGFSYYISVDTTSGTGTLLRRMGTENG